LCADIVVLDCDENTDNQRAEPGCKDRDNKIQKPANNGIGHRATLCFTEHDAVEIDTLTLLKTFVIKKEKVPSFPL
jgi:hypothetical protein